MSKLYSFWRSSASYRVRIAANLKNIDHEVVPIHFRKNGGEHKTPEFLAINPQGLLPAWTEGTQAYFQSLAIIEMLDSIYPQCQLIPEAINDKAIVNGMAQLIACEIHPLNNLRVLQYLTRELNVDDDRKNKWIHHWVKEGFTALETLVKIHGNDRYCFGESVSLTDVCLVPQVYNAERFKYDMSCHPQLEKITAHLRSIQAFDEAKPESQVDAE